MNVFISWSGDAARRLADGLHEWLQHVIEGSKPFVSTSLAAGERWMRHLEDNLRSSQCGIVCVTPASIRSPFVLFEVGMMAHSLESRIIPFRLGVEEKDVPEPLRQFQIIEATEKGAWSLVESLNAHSKLSDRVLRDAFDSRRDMLKSILGEAMGLLAAESDAVRVAQCVHPFTCFAREQGALWPNGFSEEVLKFVRLPLGEGKVELPSAVFAEQAEQCRRLERESIHILYATEDSIKNYYNQVNEEWLLSEAPPTEGRRRRRLVILEESAFGDMVYRQLTARIHEKLENTCELKLATDREVSRYFPHLLRDLGVFTMESGRLEGFASFSQVATAKLFSQSPGSSFRIRDQDYLRCATKQFNECWDRSDQLALGSAARLQMRQWRAQIPQQSYLWARAESSLSVHSLRGLIDNVLPAVRIQNFASEEECDRFVDATNSLERSKYDLPSTDPQIAMIGTPLFECRSLSNKGEYFDRAAQSRRWYEKICEKAGWDPVARLQKELNRRCGLSASLAKEDGREYFAGLVRFIEQGTLKHVDYAPADAIGYAVDNVVGQVAWNLVLRAPHGGGYCRVYNCLWCKEYDSCRVSYGYNDKVAAGSAYFDIGAVAGDVVMFNCRNFHVVAESEGERITVGSFIGKLPTGRFVLWS